VQCISQAQSTPKLDFAWCSVPDCTEELTTLPRPASRLERRMPRPRCVPSVDAFGVWMSAPRLTVRTVSCFATNEALMMSCYWHVIGRWFVAETCVVCISSAQRWNSASNGPATVCMRCVSSCYDCECCT